MNIKTLSRILLGIGLTLIVFAIFKDVSYGGYYNLHKASQQSNQLILGGFVFLAGIVAMVASRSKDSGESGAQEAVQSPSTQPTQREFAGEMDISSPPYQLFLTRQFSIEKNATLEKYVIGDAVFDALEDSLGEADRRYQAKLSEIEAEHEKVRRVANALGQRLALETIERNKREEADREKQQKLFKKTAVYFAIGAALLGTLFLISKVFESMQVNKLMGEMEANERKRSESLSQLASSGRLFGFSIGGENMNQLSDQFRTAPSENANGPGVEIQCVNEQCALLPEFQLFGDVVDSIRFEFCPTIGNGKLRKVVLWYRYSGQAAHDLESLNSRNRPENGIQIAAESMSLSFMRPEVCQ